MKRKTKKLFKSVSVFLLLVCLVISSIPLTFASTAQIESVEINDLDIIKNTSGYLSEVYNPDTDEYDLEYYEYSYEDYLSYSVTMSDGTVIEGEGYYFEYLDEYYYIDLYDDQSYKNQWGVGTHKVTAKVLGFETTFNVNVVESPVKSVVIKDIEIIKNTNGDIAEDYDYDTDEYVEYYKYSYKYDLSFVIIMLDGTVIEDEGSFEYLNKYYSIDCQDDQSYENQWDIGTHKVTANVLGFETTFNVNIIASPVKSIVIEDVDVIKNTDGYISVGYDYHTDEYIEYYRYYYKDYLSFVITMSDGTVIKDKGSYFEYLDDEYDISCEDDQSYKNQWGLGTHKVTANVLGFETTFNVNVLPSPVKSVAIKDIDIVKNTNRYISVFYNPDTDEYVEYYEYSYKSDLSFVITMLDGTVIEDEGSFEYLDKYYSIDCQDDQSYKNQWNIGTHKVTASVLGFETSFNVNIVESPYESIEILEVKPLDEKANNDYGIPNFKYKVNCKDGTSFTDMYLGNNNDNDENLTVTADKIDEWKVGNNNYFNVTYADAKTVASVEIVSKSGYEYIEQNGSLYITNVTDYQETITIPSKIDGKNVVGITSFGDATKTVKELTIPDSVKNIGDDALRWCVNLKKLNIGSGINYLEAEMFSRCDSLENINVSTANKNYASVDGIVYNKSKDILVVYPLGKGKDYQVPNSVTNIDVLGLWQYININVTFSDNSRNYKTIDGVTYTADMTKVIRCNKDKNGEYIMPNSVTKISDKAFSDCKSLNSVKISDNVTEIVYGAFENCTSLADVSIPDSVTKIGEYAFRGCKSLNGAVLPNELSTIEYMAFSNCNIANIEIPDNVKTIEANAFYSNEANEITIGKSVEKIDNYAFSNNNIESIIIPDNVKELGNYAFSGSKYLRSLKIGTGLTELPNGVFSGCGISEVTIPENIKKIGDSAFSQCEKLDIVIFQNESVVIGNSAFTGCPLKNFKPDSNISSFGMFCFSDTDMKSVSIPKTVTEITYGAFYNCKYLEDISVPENVLKISKRSFDDTKWYNNQENGEVYLDHIFYNYKGIMPKNTTVNIKKGTTTIADYAFEGCTNLTCLTLPEGLKRIGGLAFNNCSNVKTINIPASVQDIGPYAFVNCSSLTEINVSPDNKYYTSVNGVLFNKAKTELIYCPKQNTDTYVVPSSVDKIKAFAFDSNCVDNVTITNKATELEEYAIGYDLRRISYPETSSEEARVRYCNVTISCPKDSATEIYAKEHLIDISYVEATQDIKMGDANGDGTINAKDRMTLTRYLAKWSGYESVDITSADVNSDGDVNAKDRMILTRHLAKWSGYETLPYKK